MNLAVSSSLSIELTFKYCTVLRTHLTMEIPLGTTLLFSAGKINRTTLCMLTKKKVPSCSVRIVPLRTGLKLNSLYLEPDPYMWIPV